MAYLSNNPTLRTQPQRTFPGMKSVLTVGISYFQGPLPEKPGPGYGRVARYAWGEDYHPLIMRRLEEFAEHLKKELGISFNTTVAVDTKPLLERALARASGMGFVGKNTVLIVPKSGESFFHVGSFLFLAEILVSVDLSEFVAPVEGLPAVGCGGCTKCLSVCPTDAFDGPYRLKADRCIAYLTIENKGWIPREMRGPIGDWLFGCDLCQDACPFNARAVETRWPEFQPGRGAGAWAPLEDILSIKTQQEFTARWGKTALTRPKRRGLIRNACVVAGNSHEMSLVPLLEKLLIDSDPIICGHALWALAQLDPHLAKKKAEYIFKIETDKRLKEECLAVLN